LFLTYIILGQVIWWKKRAIIGKNVLAPVLYRARSFAYNYSKLLLIKKVNCTGSM
jgi:hypothetical protein